MAKKIVVLVQYDFNFVFPPFYLEPVLLIVVVLHQTDVEVVNLANNSFFFSILPLSFELAILLDYDTRL